MLPKSWEQFITFAGSDKVCRGHKSFSWVKPAKHFSPPSIFQELTQLIETTAPTFAVVTQSADKEKYFCSLAITVDIGCNQKPIALCYKVQAEEVRLYWNLTQKTGELQNYEWAPFFSEGVAGSSEGTSIYLVGFYMGWIELTCAAALWLQIQLHSLDLYWCWEPCFIIACFY